MKLLLMLSLTFFQLKAQAISINGIKNVLIKLVESFAPKKDVELPPIPSAEINAKKVQSQRLSKFNQKALPDPNQKAKYDRRFIVEIIEVVTGEKAQKSELELWANNLSQGASREGLYRALALSRKQLQREVLEKAISPQAMEFALVFLEKYIGQTYSPKELSHLNHYALPRVVTEKALEVLDALIENPTDAYAWYAVLADDLAQQYPNLWKHSVRSKVDRRWHFNWAKKVPFQHLKSEVIIKLYRVLNGV